MKQRVSVSFGIVALGLVAASTANAQGYYYPRGDYRPHLYEQQLPPWRVMRIVRSAGFVPLSAPVRRGPNYVVTAAGRSGGYVRVMVSAYDGEIVGVRPVVAYRSYGGPGPYDPRVEDPRMGDPRVGDPRMGDPRMGAAPPDQDAPPQPYAQPGARPDGYGPGGGYGPGPSANRGPLPPRNIPNQPNQRLEGAAPGSIAAPTQPPRVVPPSQRIANAPATTGAVTAAPTQPERTPIPRPRPNIAAAEAPPAAAATPAPAAAPPAANSAEVPEAPPAPIRTRPATQAAPPSPATPMVPVAPLD